MQMKLNQEPLNSLRVKKTPDLDKEEGSIVASVKIDYDVENRIFPREL